MWNWALSTPLEPSWGPSQLFVCIFLPSVAISQPHFPSPAGVSSVIALTHCQSLVTASVFSKLTLFPNDLNNTMIKHTPRWRIKCKIAGFQWHQFLISPSAKQTRTERPRWPESPPAESEASESSWRWNFAPAPEIEPFSTPRSIGLLACLNTCWRVEGLLAFSPQWGGESIRTSQKPACFSHCVFVCYHENDREGGRETGRERERREKDLIHFHGVPFVGTQTSKRTFLAHKYTLTTHKYVCVQYACTHKQHS